MKKLKNIASIVLLGTLLAGCSSPEVQTKQPTLVNKEKAKKGVFDVSEKTEGSKLNPKSELLNLDEKITIKLTPFVPTYEGIAASGSNLLKARLNAAITKIGFGGEGSNPRFVVGPSINILTQDVTSTSPTKYANTYEITLMVVDVVSETVFNTYKTEFKGVGDSPEKAFISGVRNVNYETQEFVDFLKAAEVKIFKYFESNCALILSEANAEAKIRNYDNAFAILKSVPKEAKDCFTEIQAKKADYFQLALNESCAELLAKMKAELGKFNDPSAAGFNAEAMNYYSMIDSKSDCFNDAEKEYKKYISKLKPNAKKDWNQKKQEYDDQIAMVKAEQEFKRQEAQQAYDYKVKLAEMDTKRQIEGNQKLLAKYKHDESPWLVRLFSSGSKLLQGELDTN